MTIANCASGMRSGLITFPTDLVTPPGVQTVGPGGGMASLYNGLMAFWNLDEASGVRYDSIGANHLTDNNTVGQAAGVSAQTGYSAQFVVANSEWLSITDKVALSMGDIDFTLVCWGYLSSKLANRTFMAKWHDVTNNREYFTRYNAPSDRLEFVVSGNGLAVASVFANSFGSPSLATWLFIVAKHDNIGDIISIQVNNGAVDSVAHALGVFDGSANFNLGAYLNTGAYHLDGRMDATGVWKRLLTADELTYLYNAGAGRQAPF